MGGKRSGREEAAPDGIREQSGCFGLGPQYAGVPQRINDGGDDGGMRNCSRCLHRLQRRHGLAPLATLCTKPPNVVRSEQHKGTYNSCLPCYMATCGQLHMNQILSCLADRAMCAHQTSWPIVFLPSRGVTFTFCLVRRYSSPDIKHWTLLSVV